MKANGFHPVKTVLHLLALALISLIPYSIQAQNYYVQKNNQTPEYPYNTPETASTSIQPAITAAHNETDGGLVAILDHETYYERITFFSNITLLSYGYGPPCDSFPSIVGDGRRLNDQPIVTMDGVINAAIYSCWIRNGNVSGNGAGIYVHNATNFEIVACCISENTAGEKGGGVYVGNGSTGGIWENYIFSNNAQNGAGIACDGGSVPDISYNLIGKDDYWTGAPNTATSDGGGILVSGIGTDPYISYNEIATNIAENNGGGVAIDDQASPILEGNIIGGDQIDDGNVASHNGGGFYVYNANPAILFNTIKHNNAENHSGGMYIEITIAGIMTEFGMIEGNEIVHNWAGDGGGIFIAGGMWIITQNLFSECLANPGGGGAIYITSAPIPTNVLITTNQFFSNGAVVGGGAIAVNPDLGQQVDVSIQGNTIGAPGQGNSAGLFPIPGMGGGICIAKLAGGPVLNVHIGDLTQNLIQSNGLATIPLCDQGLIIGPVWRGGGIYIDDLTDNNDVLIKNNLIGGEDNAAEGNFATDQGGGIWCRHTDALIQENTIGWNESATGGGICVSGEGSNPTINMENLFLHNVATADGGGMAVIDYAGPHVESNIFGGAALIDGNIAVGGGGGIYIHDAIPFFMDDFLEHNQAGANGGGICVVISDDFIPNQGRQFVDIIILRGIMRKGFAAANGAGLALLGAGALPGSPVRGVIDDCEFDENGAGVNGGGAFISDGGNALFINSQFTENYATGAGGGIYLRSDPGPMPRETNVSIGRDNCAFPTEGNDFFKNGAGTAGGAIAVVSFAGDAQPVNLKIMGNNIGSPGAGNTAGPNPPVTFGYGGGIFISRPAGAPQIIAEMGGIDNCANIIQENGETVTFPPTHPTMPGMIIGYVFCGGGIYGNYAADNPGELEVEVTNNQILDNMAQYGGGMWVGGADWQIYRNNFSNNIAGFPGPPVVPIGQGGAIYVDNNIATADPPSQINIGWDFDLHGNQFFNNGAASDGGAIAILPTLLFGNDPLDVDIKGNQIGDVGAGNSAGIAPYPSAGRGGGVFIRWPVGLAAGQLDVMIGGTAVNPQNYDFGNVIRGNGDVIGPLGIGVFATPAIGHVYQGGGVYGLIDQDSPGFDVDVANNYFLQNAAEVGGALWIGGGDWDIRGNGFISNLATFPLPPIAANPPPYTGGAIHIQPETVALGNISMINIGGDAIANDNNNFYDNGADDFGGAIAARNLATGDNIDLDIRGNYIGDEDLGNATGNLAGVAPFLGEGGAIFIDMAVVGGVTIDVQIGGNNPTPLCEVVGAPGYQFGNIIQGNGRPTSVLGFGPNLGPVVIGPTVLGGGISIWNDVGAINPLIVGNLIGGDNPAEGNLVNDPVARGGGIYCASTTANVVIVGQASNQFGIDFTNCIQGNQAIGAGAVGGGVSLLGTGGNIVANIVSNKIGGEADEEGNIAQWRGGGIDANTCIPVIGGSGDFDGNKIVKNVAQTGNGGGVEFWDCNGPVPALLQGNTIRWNVAEGNTATSNGGGVSCDGIVVGSNPDIFGNEIALNRSLWDGGAIWVNPLSDPTIGGTQDFQNNQILNNLCNFDGAGIALINSPVLNIQNNNIEGNDAIGDGAGIYLVGSNPNITLNWIAGNRAGFSGGESVGFGGGIGMVASSPNIIRNTILKNRADANGGGIACTQGSAPNISNSTVWHNDAVLRGGELFIDGTSQPTVNLCIFRHYGSWNSEAIFPVGTIADWNDGGNNFIRSTVWDTPLNPNPLGVEDDAEPLFRDEGIGVRNFRLSDNSPCIFGPGPDDYMGRWPPDGLGDRTIAVLNVPAPFPAIQDAINASNDGDWVVVAAGTYVENLYINKSIILIGTLADDGGPDATIIDGDGDGVVILCDGVDNRTIISGFTIQNGDAGVVCDNDADPYIVRNLIVNVGNAINADFSWIQNNTIVQNNQGITINCASPTIRNNIVVENTGALGGIWGQLQCGLVNYVPCIRGNDVWNNTPGNFTGDLNDGTQIGINGNISVDPLFVNPGRQASDFRLQPNSPCLPQNNTTGELIGAFPAGIAIQDDWGDAPDGPYPTLAINNGASHTVDFITFMGLDIDDENDGLPSAIADGDDLDNLDDEDGVIFTSGLIQGQQATINVTANVPCLLNAWIDFNQANGWEEAEEQIFTDQLLNMGLNILTFDIPPDALSGTTFARFRVNQTGGISYNDDGGPGEVEDYQVLIEEALIPGDANDDGVVNVLDIIAIVNFILGLEPDPFNFDNADVNSDGTIDVLDIIGTVNIILGGGKAYIQSEPADIYLDRELIQLRSDGTLAGIQFELKGPNLQNIELQLTLEGYQLVYNIRDEILTGIIFHPLNQSIPEGMIDLISMTGAGNITWGEVVAGNANPEEVPVNKHLLISDDYDLEVYPNPTHDGFTARMNVPLDSKVSLKLYNLIGRDQILFEGISFSSGVHTYYFDNMEHAVHGIYLIQMTALPEDTTGEVIVKQLKVVVLE